MESTEDNSENSAEDTVSTQFKEDPFDPLGKDHLIMEVLGEGTFSQVVKCYNSKTDTLEAVKILKTRSDVITLADQEVRVLKRLQCLDSDKCHIVKFNNFFFDKEGICLSFELLDLDLFTYIYDIKGTPLNSGLALSEVRAIIHQLATALHHLKTIGIIHGDIKPNNIMVVNRQEGPVKVKLADFGTAQFRGNINPNTFANTKCYSPPEILLKCPFDEAVDMWSLGLTAVVAALGTDFIPCNNTYDILKFIIKVMGQPPDHVLDNGSRTQEFFNDDINMTPKWTIKTVEQYEHETGTTTTKHLDEVTHFDNIKDEIIFKQGNQTGLDLFVDLIQKMLDVDPDKRIMPLEVLLHSFFAVTEAEAERDMGLSEQSSCFCIEEEQDDQLRTDFDTYVDSLYIQPIESTEDQSENIREDSVSTQNREYLFDPLGKDHLIMEVLGEGTFAQVVKCYNSKTDSLEAVKILKTRSDVITLADQEVRVLKWLQCLDSDKCHIVKFNNFFFDKEGICLSFELLDLDLFTYIYDIKGTPLNSGLALSEVRAIIHQLVTALHHLKTIGIIHGDIKPNNIMVVNRQEGPVKVKLADFGTAQFRGNINPNTFANTKCYSPPEILLKCPFDEAVDMWSLGLTAVVAALGTDFIQYNNNTYDILKFIIKVMGQPPDHVLDNGSRTRAFFNEDINMTPKWTIKTVEQYEHETGTTTTKHLDEVTHFDNIKDEIIFKQGNQTGLDLFVDLIQKMLDVDPDKRIMPLEVLLHSFFAVTEAEAERDMGLSEQSSCFCIEEEQDDQYMSDFDTYVDSLYIQPIESTEDQSENIREDSVSTQNREYLFDPLGKDHLIMEVLGEGTFAQVVKCYNSKTDSLEAVKILKTRSDVITLADQEVRVLKWLQCLDSDKCHIVKFNNFFFDKEGICLSFELLDLDLFTYIYDIKGTPLNSGLALSEVRAIIHQLVTALHHLKTIGIIHGDIKPNNIMVVNRQEGPVKVKLADFGTAQFRGNINPNTFANTKCYSPPEILLKCPFDEAVDMWSLGLTAVVAALGTDFIPCNNTYDILKFIIKVMGQPPDHVLDNGNKTRAFFNEDIKMTPKWTIKTAEQYEHETGTPTLKYVDELSSFNDIKDDIILKQGNQTGLDLFVDLIQKMLDVDPGKRIMPLEVLLHSFFAVTEAEAERDMGLSEQSSCVHIEKEQEDQYMSDFDTSVMDSLNFWPTESIEDKSENFTEDSVSTQNKDNLFDQIGKGHLIMEVLGEGTFAQVVKCYNSKTDTLEAVKILKTRSDVITLADQEVRVLKRLRCLDPDKCHIVKFNNFFYDKEGICLSFELLDLDLFTYIYDTKGTPLNSGLALSEVRAIIHQLATALHHLKTIGIIHGDIKPNNIMVVSHQKETVKVKLADFGTAQICGNINPNTFANTKHYSPPEILLKCPFNEAVDMWSLGLTAVVAALGTDFIPCNNTYDILKIIIKMMGQPPDHVLDNGNRTRAFFNEDIKMTPKWTIKTAEQYEHETGTPTLKYVDELSSFNDIKDDIILKQGNQTGLDLFVDLIQKMLDVDPDKRIMPLEVLLHSFFAVTEAEAERDMGLSEQSSCFHIEKEQEDQFRTDFDTYVDGLYIQPVESTEDNSEDSVENNVSTQNKNNLFDQIGKDHLIMEVLGEGTFAQVIKCYNSKTDTLEAVKILKSCPDLITLADQEVRVLKRLQCLDPDKCHIVKFNNFFFDKKGICLSFELLDLDLFTYISNVKCTPLNSGLALSEVRAIIHQLAKALHHLKTIGIIHGDIKPNNIMVVNRQEGPVKVKLADFGGAQFRGNINSETVVNTKCYSPPEILLKCPFDEAVDMWSLGLTAVVAALGTDFIQYNNNTYDILKFIIKVMGQPPDHVLDNGSRTRAFFNEDINMTPKWTIKTVEQYEHETGTTTLKYLDELNSFNDIKDKIIFQQGYQTGLDLFVDLIQKMLDVDPDKRIMPLEVLLHSFFAVTEAEAERDMGLSEQSSCFHIEKEQEDQYMSDFTIISQSSQSNWYPKKTYLEDHLDIHRIEFTKDMSKNIAVHQRHLDVLLDFIQERFPFHLQNLNNI